MSSLKIPTLIITCIILASVFVVVIKSHQPLYKGPSSDHFDGRRFFYKDSHSFTDMLQWFWEMQTIQWPEWINDPPQPKPVERVKNGKLRVTYINHATVLIQMDGLNILTDPFWSERAGPVSWIGSKRVREPGVKMEDLPGIDVILISHDHYDHLDLTTLKQLEKKFKPQILLGLGVKSLLNSNEFTSVLEMDWWQEYVTPSADVKFTFVPARHNSGRSLLGNNRTLWGGFVIEGSDANIYFAGDTAHDEFLDSIKKRFGSFSLTILPIGSYEKRWFMKTQHMNPEDAVNTHKLLESKQSVGIHFGTVLEHPEQAIDDHEKDLQKALKENNVPKSEFWVLRFGEGKDVLQ